MKIYEEAELNSRGGRRPRQPRITGALIERQPLKKVARRIGRGSRGGFPRQARSNLRAVAQASGSRVRSRAVRITRGKKDESGHFALIAPLFPGTRVCARPVLLTRVTAAQPRAGARCEPPLGSLWCSTSRSRLNRLPPCPAASETAFSANQTRVGSKTLLSYAERISRREMLSCAGFYKADPLLNLWEEEVHDKQSGWWISRVRVGDRSCWVRVMILREYVE